ncbi:hypothetical protein B0H11DRAFT_1902325 [Mycena galericulata]|nr:hypothetical protein B0H11DRAFT_1902325 [Mycena galericulata]
MAEKRSRRPSQRSLGGAELASSDSEQGGSGSRTRPRQKRRTHSRVSQSSSPGPAGSESAQTPAPALTKREKFDVRYKTSTRSDAEVLDAQKSAWTSDVYSHFREPEIVRENDEVKYKFVCKK